MTEYSRDDYRRISGVGIINRSGPDAGGSGGMYRDNRRKKGNGNFASILQGEQHKENEAGPASSMLLGCFHNIIDIQLVAGLDTVDALMLRPVVLERPSDILHQGNERDIRYENGKLEHTLDHCHKDSRV